MTDKIVMDHTPPATAIEANVLHIANEADKPQPQEQPKPDEKPQEGQPAVTVTTTVPVPPSEQPKEND